MGTTLNRHSYEQLISEDLEWLLKQPRTLESHHIEAIVRRSADLEYARVQPVDDVQVERLARETWDAICAETTRGGDKTSVEIISSALVAFRNAAYTSERRCADFQPADYERGYVEGHKAGVQLVTRAILADVSRAEVVEVITDMQEGRHSHQQWLDHLSNPQREDCQGCDDHAAHVGDAEHHRQWIEKYDRAIRLLTLVPLGDTAISEPTDLVSRRAAMSAICYMCAKPEHYGPPKPLGGSERLFHFQGINNWNAGQCDAQAIIGLSGEVTGADEAERPASGK